MRTTSEKKKEEKKKKKMKIKELYLCFLCYYHHWVE